MSLTEQIDALPILDSLQREEDPLSNGGKWEAEFEGVHTGIDTLEGLKSAGPELLTEAEWATRFSGDCALAVTLHVVGTGGTGPAVDFELFRDNTFNLVLAEIEGSGETFLIVQYEGGGKSIEVGHLANGEWEDGDRVALAAFQGSVYLLRKRGGVWSTVLSGEVDLASLGIDEGKPTIIISSTTTRLTNFAAGSLTGGGPTVKARVDGEFKAATRKVKVDGTFQAA